MIDLDDEGTWPAPIRTWVDGQTAALVGTTQYTPDLPITAELNEEFAALVDSTLRAYHCARLLPHEVASIREQGLRLLSRELVDDRLVSAAAHGALTAEECYRLRGAHVFAQREEEHRENQICLVFGRQILDFDAHGVTPLLGNWGGEGIYRFAPADLRPLLERLGTPSIVEARLSVEHVRNSFPPLPRLFVGKALGLHDVGADVFYGAAIPGQDILDVWQPGNAEYDRHAQLPR